MMKEGQIRIPAGCAIAAVISKEGNRMSGEAIINAMRPMHARSNGLGGGFAAYGIYPQYRDYYDFQCRSPADCGTQGFGLFRRGLAPGGS